jgi:hypothetical protein
MFRLARLGATQFAGYLTGLDASLDPRVVDGAGCVGVDVEGTQSDEAILGLFGNFVRDRFPQSQWEPDIWAPFVVRDLAETGARLAAVAGEKYSYKEMNEFTDMMEKALLATGRKDVDAPLVAKVNRSGVLPERVYVIYSQERLASHGFRPGSLTTILRDRNLTAGGGEFDASGKRVLIHPTGEFTSENEIGDVTIGTTSYGTPVHLRDVADVVRSYESPARFLK